MSDPTSPPPPQGQAGLQIPAGTTQQFGELIELIKKSESMNEEERQYWINILPVMTPEQIQNLRGILENERKQLSAIDSKYQTEIEKLGTAESLEKTDTERRTRRMERSGAEATNKEKEDQATADLLRQIEETGSATKPV